MDKRLKECAEKLRKLVSDVQGAPYPGSLDNELYMIWYEHIQKNAIDCFEYLDANIPPEKSDVSDALKNIKQQFPLKTQVFRGSADCILQIFY